MNLEHTPRGNHSHEHAAEDIGSHDDRRDLLDAETVIPLPPSNMRMGGEHFRSDAQFRQGALRDVDLLTEVAGLSLESRVLDWGCGAGRLAIGIKLRFGHVHSYIGVDVQQHLVEWAESNLADSHTKFLHVAHKNDRYNSAGAPASELPLPDAQLDLIYAYSVFSHMLDDDVRHYLREFARVLRPGGRAFLTAFVELGVGSTRVNPGDYGALKWSGPLHCVLYDLSGFCSLIHGAGLHIERYIHGQETDGQSSFVIVKTERVPRSSGGHAIKYRRARSSTDAGQDAGIRAMYRSTV